LSRLRR